MCCVKSVRYTVKYNGELLEPFIPSRGLRQGDPLSPYIFLFVAEGLTCLLEKEVQLGRITPVKIARGSPGISNLLFADDSLLFFKADGEEAKVIKHVLDLFQRGSGQLLSNSKCSILFSEVCPSAVQQNIKQVLEISTSTFESKYLGLPTPEGRMKECMFQPIMERFIKRCSDWTERYMSHAAKETLVKSVIQSLPTYCMGVFKMTQGFCEKYERLIRDFWWGDDSGHRKVHWMAWEQMIKPKRGGGIGFRDMKLFNQALLARQAWRLIERPESLCARVLKSKYYPNGNLLDTVFASDASPVWRGIEHGLELLKKGLIWRIGDGTRINIQRDQWIPRKEGLKTTNFIRRCRLRWVNQLMQPDGTGWNTDLIRQLFYRFDAEAICNIKLPKGKVEDCLAWHYEKKGIFSVRSAYWLAATQQHQNNQRASSSTNDVDDRSIWGIIWKAKVPGKIRIFGWRVATNTLATKKNKWRRTLEVDSTCKICGNGEEDEFHAVVACTKSRALRNEMRAVWDLPAEDQFRNTGEDWLQHLLDPCSMESRVKTLLLLWRCWFLRDDCIHGSGKELIGRSVDFLTQYVAELEGSDSELMEHVEGKQAHQHAIPPPPECVPYTASTARSMDQGGDSESVLFSRWRPPTMGTVKVNTDASFLRDSGQCHIGAVARDYKGQVFFSLSKRGDECSTVEEAEAQAMLSGIRLLSSLYRGAVCVETDCSFLAKELQSGARNRSACHPMICDIRAELVKFPSAQFSLARREQNSLAHSLAARARSKEDLQLIASVPGDLEEVWKADSALAPE